MIAMLTFSAAAALLVWLAGRSDAARDPRLTTTALALLAVFPLLLVAMPKLGVLPPAGVTEIAVHTTPTWIGWLVGVWLIVSLAGLFRLFLAAREIARWRENSELLQRIGRVEIRMLAGLRGPVATGVFRPVVFVPGAWETWDAPERRIVLDHELAHHHRHDPLRRWIAAIACAVHAYNPLVLWMTRRLSAQCEFACDAVILANGTAPSEYARLLCSVAEERPHAAPVLAMAEAAGLESRVRRLMQPRGTPGFARIAILIATTAGVAGAISSLGRQQPDPMVPSVEIELRWSAKAFPAD